MPAGIHSHDPCPCHSGSRYGRCCGPFHDGAPAPTPEALMRSRYAAYAVGLVDYVMDTTDPEGPQARDDREAWAADLQAFVRATRFVGLEIGDAGERGDQGWVSFRAVLVQGKRDASFRERSTFVRRDGRWHYVAGS